MSLYGSLQGPQIPDSVDKINLPLGRQRLKIVKILREGTSKDGASINVSYLVASADQGVRGTAFFRFNFRHQPFNVGNEVLPSYLDATFPNEGMKRLEKIADGETQAAEPARKELTRARIALSTLKRVNVLAGLGPVLGYDSQRWLGTEFEGIITHVDRSGNKMRLNKDGKAEFVNKKGQPIPANIFDEDSANAEVTTIFAAPKDKDQHEVPAAPEDDGEEETQQ